MNRFNATSDRRDFLKKAGLLAASSALPFLATSSEKPVRIGFVGVGGRGMGMLNVALSIPGVQIVAICDIVKERVERGQRLVTQAGQPKPRGYSQGPEDYRRLVEQGDLDAVYTATPFDLHTPVMLASMRAGKFGATEMPACSTMEEAWELVETSEKTGVPCMLMENYCYMRNVQMILNMVQQQAFGVLTHCEVGYQHDARYVNFEANGDLLWRGNVKLKHNGNHYPTHAIGPASQWLNVNRGDRLDYLVSMSSRAAGMKHYAERIGGKDHPSKKLNYRMGDVNTTLIRTHSGVSITLYYDTQNPRPVDFIWRVQGTSGIYSGTLDKIHLEDRSPAHQWEPASNYLEEYDHPNWRKYGEIARQSGHGGSDYLCFLDFVTAVRNKTEAPIDVYDAVTWSIITELSEKSADNKSRPVDFPDFTRDKWKSRPPSKVKAI